jgi:hypothetical protein
VLFLIALFYRHFHYRKHLRLRFSTDWTPSIAGRRIHRSIGSGGVHLPPTAIFITVRPIYEPAGREDERTKEPRRRDGWRRRPRRYHWVSCRP